MVMDWRNHSLSLGWEQGGLHHFAMKFSYYRKAKVLGKLYFPEP